MNNSYKDLYLKHHGISGQKWGKRNGPPYPLDDNDHSASEKKADWKKSLRKQKRAEKRAQKQEIKKEKKAYKNEIKKEMATIKRDAERQYKLDKYRDKMAAKMDKKLYRRARRHPKSASNEAVRKAIERVRQEQELKSLSKKDILKQIENNNKKKDGVVKQAVSNASKNVITNALTKAGDEIAGRLINKIYGKEVVETESKRLEKQYVDREFKTLETLTKGARINIETAQQTMDKYGKNKYTDLISEKYGIDFEKDS